MLFTQAHFKPLYILVFTRHKQNQGSTGQHFGTRCSGTGVHAGLKILGWGLVSAGNAISPRPETAEAKGQTAGTYSLDPVVDAC